MPSLNPDIRRAAADQLVTLTQDPRFAHALSDPALMHAIHNQLTSSNTDLGSGFGPDNAQLIHVQRRSGDCQQQQDPDGFSTQLMVTCLQLLVALVQHCQESRGLLLQGSGRLGTQPH